MKCSRDSEILHKIVCDTTQISSHFSDFFFFRLTHLDRIAITDPDPDIAIELRS